MLQEPFRGPSSLRRLFLGYEWVVTRRALLLAVGFLVAVGGIDLALSIVVYGTIPEFVYGFRDAFLLESDFDLLAEPWFGAGTVVVVGLAAVHAYRNEGYLPSLLLATAPIYATYLFTVPGPVTGPVVPVADHVVFAPNWAARHVLPNTVAYGTVGFVLGIGIRYTRRRQASRGAPADAG